MRQATSCNFMNRVSRVNRLIKKEISQIILKEMDSPKDVLVTVTRVETSANLIQTKVYLSVMPESRSPVILKSLRNSIYHLQQSLNKRLAMRPTPKIVFVEEKVTKQAGRVEELLEKIKKD